MSFSVFYSILYIVHSILCMYIYICRYIYIYEYIVDGVW